jgi:hypothetical protein
MEAIWSLIWSLIKIAVLVSAVQFLLGPIVTYFTMRQAAKPKFQSFDLLDPPMQLPPSHTQNIALLEELGFTAVAHLFAVGQARSSRYVLTLFINQAERDMANVVHMLSETALARVAVNYLEFSTEFEDRSSVITNNSKQPGVFVKVPEKKIFRLPHLTEPKQLYAVHRALLIQEVMRKKWLPPAGEEVNDLADSMGRDLARQARLGLLRLDSSGLWYRPTVTGAILMICKLAWPVGSLRRLIQRQRGKQLVRALRVDDQ